MRLGGREPRAELDHPGEGGPDLSRRRKRDRPAPCLRAERRICAGERRRKPKGSATLDQGTSSETPAVAHPTDGPGQVIDPQKRAAKSPGWAALRARATGLEPATSGVTGRNSFAPDTAL